MNDKAPALEKAYRDACDIFNVQCTALFEPIAGAVDFSGPFMTHDLQWLDSDNLRDYRMRFSWGDILWEDILQKVAKRKKSTFAPERNIFYNDVKWDAASALHQQHRFSISFF